MKKINVEAAGPILSGYNLYIKKFENKIGRIKFFEKFRQKYKKQFKLVLTSGVDPKKPI